MANDKNFKVKNGLQAGRYLHQTAGLSDPYDGVTIRPVFHYDMIANVFTADLQLDDISFAGELYTSSGLEPWDTTIVDTSISNYSSASWFPVNTGTIAGRVNRDSGGTPSTGTGRTDAVSDSFYLYFETTSPANTSNYDFLLRGEEQELSAAPTFSFYEARNGTSLGNLNVYVDVVESPWDSIPVGLTSQLLQTTGDVDAWVQKTVPMDMFYRPPGSKVVDLKIADHFTHTLTADTTLYFENPPPSGSAGSFALEVTGADVAVGYDLANAAYSNKMINLSTTAQDMEGIFFKPDGLTFYAVTRKNADSVKQYSLTTAWDISTCSTTATSSITVSSQNNSMEGLFFKPDGTKMYLAGSSQNQTVFEYDLSTAWDLSTASYNNVSVDVSANAVPWDVTFKPDGTKMYLADSNYVEEYSLSTAWDITSATHTVRSPAFSSSGGTTSVTALAFNADGSKMFAGSASNGRISEYDLTTAWDVSTLQTSTVDYYVTSADSSFIDIGAIFFGDGAGKMYVTWRGAGRVYQFNTEASAPATITYPSSVKWSGATTPDAPAAGEKDVYVFVTTDGGTTYYGKQAGDAVA
jgi:hypothetical protein